MAKDRFRDRLSDFLDGEVGDGEIDRFERHLEECEGCAQTLAELRVVVRQARTTVTHEPATDLWPGIAARLAAPGLVAERQVRARLAAGLSWVRRAGRIRRAVGGRIALSVPQLAAAAVVLASLSAGLAWMVGTSRSSVGELADGGYTAPNSVLGFETGIASGADPAAKWTSAASPALQSVWSGGDNIDADEYLALVARFENALFNAEPPLPPETMARIRRALVTIDRAIIDAEQALRQAPDDPYIEAHIASTLQRKAEFLQQAVFLTAGN